MTRSLASMTRHLTCIATSLVCIVAVLVCLVKPQLAERAPLAAEGCFAPERRISFVVC
jgi:hypothetical protein